MDDSSSSFKKKLSYLEHLAPKNISEHTLTEKKITGNSNLPIFKLPGTWEKTGKYTYTKSVMVHNPITFSDYSFCPLIPRGCSPRDLLFFDLETTGLSGGAGNICFLIGIGQIKADGFEIRQVFLSDFPGEEEFLGTIVPFFTPDKLFVSYNGKSFDSHLIRSRCIMNHIKCEIEKQFDLLHISRRFFKQMIGSCSLGDIEEKILSIHRENDVNGFEVPDIYFNFLRTGETGDLIRVFDHNFQDILSLAYLFRYIVSLTSPSTSPDNYIVDKGALGLLFLEYGNEQGLVFLTDAMNSGDMRAGKNLSLYYKRHNAWEKAAGIWKIMVSQCKSTFAAIELAKYYEHRKKEYKQALEWVEKIFEFPIPLPLPERMDLLKRKDRLVGKLEEVEKMKI